MNFCPVDGVRYLFLDLNSYFASCEQQEHPDLRGEPVIVVPLDSDSTCAIAASYEAKRFGIKTGTKVFEAKRLCPRLRIVPARHQLYVHYHHKLLEEFVRHTPIRTVWSIDEWDSRLGQSFQTKEAAEALAKRIKAGIRANVGDTIRASIGIAPTSFLGKVASDMQKPDGLVTLEGRDLPGRLLDLELTDLCGIAKNMKIRLNRGGIFTMRELWDCDPKRFRRVWGGVGGERFWYKLHGYDVPETDTSRSVFGHSRVLDPELRTPDSAHQVIRRLTAKAVMRMRRERFLARAITLHVRGIEYGDRWGGELRLTQTDDVLKVLRALDELWSHIETAGPARIKKVSMALHDLIPATGATLDLFEDLSAPAAQVVEKPHAQIHSVIPDYDGQEEQSEPVVTTAKLELKNLTDMMSSINRKFGAQSINFGMIPELKGGHLGTKIAFSRIPDRAEFWE